MKHGVLMWCGNFDCLTNSRLPVEVFYGKRN